MSKKLEIFELINSLFAGIMIGIFIMFCINFFTLKKDVSFNPEDLNNSIEQLETKNKLLDKAVDEFQHEMNDKFTQLNAKIDKLLAPKAE